MVALHRHQLLPEGNPRLLQINESK